VVDDASVNGQPRVGDEDFYIRRQSPFYITVSVSIYKAEFIEAAHEDRFEWKLPIPCTIDQRIAQWRLVF
jgi:hypothetical protein